MDPFRDQQYRQQQYQYQVPQQAYPQFQQPQQQQSSMAGMQQSAARAGPALDVLYSTHVVNKASVPVRIRAEYSTSVAGASAAAAAASGDEQSSGQPPISQNYEQIVLPGRDVFLNERFRGPDAQNIRLQITKIFAESISGNAKHIERQSPWGPLDKSRADFEVVEDGLGNLQLNKLF